MTEADVQSDSPASTDPALVGAEEERGTSALFRNGAIVTGAYVTAMLAYTVGNWPNLLDMRANEFGDFLAGVFSPIAFLWLVLGFLQQGRELSLQIKELRHSVTAQNNLVEATRDRQFFDAETLRAEQEEVARMAAPILRFSTAGSGGGHDGQRKFSFRVLNEGKPVSGAKLYRDDVLSNELGNISTGDFKTFSAMLPMDNSPISIPVRLTYFASRNVAGEANAVIERESTDVTIRALT